MKRPAAAVLVLPLLLLAACGQQAADAGPGASVEVAEAVKACGQQVSGQEDPNRLAVSAVPLGEESVGVTFRGYGEEGSFHAYLIDGHSTVIGTSGGALREVGTFGGALREGRATITTLCTGVTWQQVLDHRDFEDKVAVVLSRPGRPDLLAAEPLFVKAL
ncbi:hypothetical protein ABZ747_25485 [Kitasatospora cineracea]|uniref:hypothetical protein n=1 Tax=Kitasatospora cineracea TaxID=88074 RepID=UPI0033DC4594